MNYLELIKTVSEIVENDSIVKTGLMLTYSLPDKLHRKMQEEFFYRTNPPTAIHQPDDIFEVELGGILINFIKIPNEISQ